MSPNHTKRQSSLDMCKLMRNEIDVVPLILLMMSHGTADCSPLLCLHSDVTLLNLAKPPARLRMIAISEDRSVLTRSASIFNIASTTES